MEYETERKFLVDKSKFNNIKSQYPFSDIRQAYIAVTDTREVRLRTIDNKEYKLTIKSGGELSRKESELNLTEKQARNVKPLLQTDILHKHRYYISYKNSMIEADEFLDNLEGLIIAEVEFKNQNKAEMFNAPGWFEEEVTGQTQYRGKNLVGKTMDELSVSN